MTETIETLSLGQQLKNARETLKLSIKDVSHKTNLKKSHLESLENDIFIFPDVPPTFVRGYMRKYVRFLRLPESLVQQANYGEVTIPKEVKKAAAIPVSNNYKSQNRWIKWLTVLVLLGAVGMTLAWWWQEHKKDEVSRDSLVNSSEMAVNNIENSTNSANLENFVTTVDEKAEQVETVAQKVVDTETVENTENREVATGTMQNVEVQVVPVAPTQLQAETARAILAEQTQNSVQVTEEPTQNEPVVVGNDELRIEIQGGQSWITVRSTKSKKSLAEQLYNDGEVLTFNDNEQYRLTIGAPAYVKIYYKGELIPLKVDGRVARIKLPQ